MRLSLLALFVALTGTGCSAEPKKQIVGKWDAADGSSDVQALEFVSDGVLKVYLKGDATPVEGTYELDGGKLLKVKVRSQITARLKERAQRVGTNSVSVPFWIMKEQPTEVTLSKTELAVPDGDKKHTYNRAK